MSSRTLRFLALLLPWPVVMILVLPDEGHALVIRAAEGLGLLWIAMALALVVHLHAGRRSEVPAASRIDVLTATGASVVCAGGVALLASQLFGWASLAVVGALGIAAVHLAVIWSLIVAGGDRPWRRAAIERAIVPAHSVEGEPLRDEIRLAGVGIPAGMRLFVLGRTTRHGAISRHVVESAGSRATLELVSDLGPAKRGVHRTPPLALWLGDVLGLTRMPIVQRAEASFTVIPRVERIDGFERLLGLGGDDATSVETRRLPTEGSFRIRDYVPGDDARRIHWVRSLQQEQLVVRMPDEIPTQLPAVRLILDDELPNTDGLTCRSPDELIDGLVRVWVSLGIALAKRGVRVTIVTAIAQDGVITRVDRAVIAHSPRELLRLAARVTWQAKIPLDELARSDHRSVTARAPSDVIISARPRTGAREAAWVIVPEVRWTTQEPPLPIDRPLRYPFPIGCAENRRGRRRLEQQRITTSWTDRLVFSELACLPSWTRFSGSHIAHPKDGRVALTVIP